MLMYHKNLFDRYYCIVILLLDNFGEKASKVQFFVVPIMEGKGMNDALVLTRGQSWVAVERSPGFLALEALLLSIVESF